MNAQSTTKKIEAIVMTRSAKCPSSWTWSHPRRRVAVVLVDRDIIPTGEPSMISDRSRGVHGIVETWERLYVGSSERSQYAVALREACDMAARLNMAAL